MAASQGSAKVVQFQSQQLGRRVLQPLSDPGQGEFCRNVLKVISESPIESPCLWSFQLFYKHKIPTQNPSMFNVARVACALEY